MGSALASLEAAPAGAFMSLQVSELSPADTSTNFAKSPLTAPRARQASTSGPFDATQSRFGLLHKLRTADPELRRNAEHQGERRLALTSFQLAVVRPVDIGLEGEGILGVTLLDSQGAHSLAKCLRHKRFERSRPRLRYRQFLR